MERRIIQRPGLGAGGCSLCGLKFVIWIDAVLSVCFCYMLIREFSDYSKYAREGECTKPFGLFWIGHFTSIVMFRIFYYLEKFAEFRLAMVFFENDNTRLRSARFWAITVKVCKLLSYFGFLVFTILGSLWFVEDGMCLNKLDDNNNNHSYIKMAIWLLGSFVVCLIYAIRVLIKLLSESAPRELVQGDDNRLFSRFMWADQARLRGRRPLTKRELTAIKKSRLRNYDELGRFVKEPSRPSLENAIEMTQQATSEPIPLNMNSSETIDEGLKEDEENPYQFTCAVCLEDVAIGEWYKKLPQCQHFFHATCIDQWLSTRATCPVCRQEVLIYEIGSEQGADGSNPSARAIPREIRISSGSRNTEPRVVLRFTRVVS